VAAIIGGYMLAHYHQPDQAWNTDIKTVMLGDLGPGHR